MRYLYLGVAGAIGTIARYALGGLVYRFVEPSFPWATLLINALGCFAIGLFYQAFEVAPVSPDVRTAILIGLIGGFTTYSTFSLETVNLLRDGELAYAGMNVLAHVAIGIAAVFGGLGAAKVLVG
jgi:CrcB protein